MYDDSLYPKGQKNMGIDFRQLEGVKAGLVHNEDRVAESIFDVHSEKNGFC